MGYTTAVATRERHAQLVGPMEREGEESTRGVQVVKLQCRFRIRDLASHASPDSARLQVDIAPNHSQEFQQSHHTLFPSAR